MTDDATKPPIVKQKLAARAALSHIFPRYDIIRIAEIRLGTAAERVGALWFGSQGLRSGVCGMSGSTDARTLCYPIFLRSGVLLRSSVASFQSSSEVMKMMTR